ncbi:MAG: PH domain-containing protein [Propionibacteriaceae bacterium]|jgi:membrane protein YdbS with pleckstrin-like domain|nr:PH domain-containing protein [Propionibacteriaceae bacterium]
MKWPEIVEAAAEWRSLPARYASAWRVNIALWTLVFALAAGLPLGLLVGWGWGGLAAAAVVAIGAWRFIRAGRWVRSFGYALREEDLLIRKGLWRREFAAIPYGRMQSVTVEAGPLNRLWGLADVSLVTASIQSDAKLPGLLEADAAALRDRLITLGESQATPM